MKPLSPTQRTLRALREQGVVYAVVERWNPYGVPHGIRQDLFGIIDVLALDPLRAVVGVQSAGHDFSGHYRKLTEDKPQEYGAYTASQARHAVYYSRLIGWRNRPQHHA